MEKTIMIILLNSIFLVNGYSYDSYYDKCKQFEHKIYRLTVTFPNLSSFSVLSIFGSNGHVTLISSVQNGNNANEFGFDAALSDTYGRYECSQSNILRITGLGYIFKSNSLAILQDNGAIFVVDISLRFTNKNNNVKGALQVAFYKNGVNLFTTDEEPLLEGDVADVKGELFNVRTLNKLSNL